MLHVAVKWDNGFHNIDFLSIKVIVLLWHNYAKKASAMVYLAGLAMYQGLLTVQM